MVDGSAKDGGSWRPHIRAQGPRALLVAAGFALGAGVFGARSCLGPTHDAETEMHSEAAGARTWTCAMHPSVQRSEPGMCPICGMDLIPVPSGEVQRGSPDEVVLSERAQALARLRTSEVRRRPGAAARVRLLGRFEPNEATLKTVTAWTGGRIDRLQVAVTGERVRAGQVVATLYSPEVFSAHQDLLVAKRQQLRMQEASPSSLEAAQAALEAARVRLRLLGVPDDELVRMEAEERPTRAVPVRTPFSGTVIERMATEGIYVSTGTPLYRVANLQSLWLQLDAYESDLPQLDVGQEVEVSVDALPGQVFEGKVTFIEPTLDRERRTAQVRVEVDNRERRLRPGMFAEATVASREPLLGSEPLVVPATAPLFTGRRALVYVESSPGTYAPRTVRLGPRTGDYYPVVAGLSEGERVVSRGAFAIDADLQIRGGPSMMAAPDDRQTGDGDEAVELAPARRATLKPVVRAYLEVQAALADDDLAEALQGARNLTGAVEQVGVDSSPAARDAWNEIASGLRTHAGQVATAESLEGARQGFEPLSHGIIRLLTRFGNPLDRPLRLAFCPMASGSEGAVWVQPGSEIDNSYFGATMLTCGEVRQQVDPGGYLQSTGTDAGDRR